MAQQEHTKDSRAKQSPKKTHTRWYAAGVQEIVKKFAVSPSKGLSEKNVIKRLRRHGRNKLPEPPRTGAVILFFRQFKNSLTYILLIAACISYSFGEHIDAFVILAAVVVNVVVGFIQEYRAQTALAALARIITQRIFVIRDGKEREIDTAELVPGDIVIIAPGTKIPADGRILEAEYLKISEAALTGESEPTEKNTHMLEGERILAEQENMVFSGTVVTEGRGRFMVIATGEKTELGKIATLVRQTEEVRTPLQIKLDRFSRKLALLVLGLSLMLFLVGLYYGHTFVQMFNTAVAVAVSAIPEGLIVAVTVILAVGMQRILKKRSLVRKLVAAETLGSTSVICADKTGTLTIGEMRVAHIATEHHAGDFRERKTKDVDLQKGQWEMLLLHKIAFNCNNAVLGAFEKDATKKEQLSEDTVIGTPTEKALLLSALDAGFDSVEARTVRPRLDEVPFDSSRKFMATLHGWTKKQQVIYFKGAPEKIISMASKYQSGRAARAMPETKRKEILNTYEQLSKEGLRVLAAAYKPVSVAHTTFEEINDYAEKTVFVGFWGIKDPLRNDTKKSLKQTKKAHIRTIMITGDNRYTAEAIAAELGLAPRPKEIIDASELASLSERDLEKKVKTVKVFSRATPKDKLRIIHALQENGEVVAMTGDGVNDAPALQAADIGVAVGSGTDVAKETADLVLLDNNFSVIVAAVRQGRVTFDNIRKVTLYLLSDSFSEMIIVMAGLLLGWPLALLPAQILWINLVTDGLPHLALTQEPEEPEIMTEPPQNRAAPLLDFERKFLILFISGFTALITLALFYLVLKTSGDLDRARTVAFVTIGIDSLLYVFSARSVRHTIFDASFFSNKWLLGAVAGGFVIQILGVYVGFFQTVLSTVPLGIVDWLLVLFAVFWVIVSIEVAKYIFIIRRRNGHQAA